MHKLTLVLGIVIICSSGAAAQKKSQTYQSSTKKWNAKTTQGEKHPAHSSVAPPISVSGTKQTAASRDLSKTESKTATLLAGTGGSKSGKMSTRALPMASAKAGQKSDRSAPINFQYHAPKGASTTRPAQATPRSGRKH